MERDRFLTETMIPLPGGSEQIRRFHDDEKWLSSDYGMSIPSGGKHQSQTVETVEINPFTLARVPVTNRFYRMIMDGKGDSDSDLLPKVNISWQEAVLFCNRASRFFGLEEYYSLDGNSTGVICRSGSKGFRLPTDAEWQYACRAGTQNYQYGEIDEIAWHRGNSGGFPHGAGGKQPNQWGLYDMLGNVWEWVWDLYDRKTYRSYRIFRGGSFAEEGRICGATTRRKSHHDFAIDDLGFRLAR
jgi:formylglycine-generating enzyme required for sulfatase activity